MVSDCANPTVAADENGIVWAASSGLGGIANSTDNGNSWVRVNEGLMDPDVMCLAFDSRGTLFAGISQGGGIAYTTDNGETWVGSGLSTSDWIDAITATDTNNLLATGNNSFYKSTDKAKTWSAIPFPSPNFYVYSFYQSGPGEILAASNQGVLSSTTNGDSWTSLLKNSLNNFSITCDPNGWIFVGTDSGVFLSINHGANWTAINNGLTNTDVRAMTMLPDGKLFAGTWGGGIFRSTDKGGTWVEYNSGLTGTYVQSFGVNTLGDVFAGISGGGVCRSRDDGSNWEPINSGLTFLNNTRALAVSPTGYLFAGTFARGVYRSVSPTTTVNELPAPFPSRFELAQNFPNPFNPATTIRYQVSQRTRVVLTVFDLLGRKVMNLVDNIEEPGLKTVRFDATGLSTGIYLYRMQAGSYNQTRKFILLK